MGLEQESNSSQTFYYFLLRPSFQYQIAENGCRRQRTKNQLSQKQKIYKKKLDPELASHTN
jgi:hypothetical protein